MHPLVAFLLYPPFLISEPGEVCPVSYETSYLAAIRKDYLN